MRHLMRGGQRVFLVFLPLWSCFGCEATAPTTGPAVSKSESSPNPAEAPTAPPSALRDGSPAPRILTAEELRDGGRLAPLDQQSLAQPQRLPPIDPAQPSAVSWPQPPVPDYPRTRTP